MTEQDKTRFGKLLKEIGKSLKGDIDADVLNYFWETLKDLPFETIQKNAIEYGKTAKFFPKPSDLRSNYDSDVYYDNSNFEHLLEEAKKPVAPMPDYVKEFMETMHREDK